VSVLRWEEPPTNYVSWKKTVAELRTKPGVWARVLEPTAQRRANAVVVHVKKHGAEAVARKVDGQGVGVWARWVG
jgi:hypothetical protein